MSWVNDNLIQPSIDASLGLLGINDDPKNAANAQVAAAEKAIAFQREALGQARKDLAPFKNAGANQLQTVKFPDRTIPSLTDLVRDPVLQKNFITNNPFFDELANDAQSRIFNNAAARGKVGSGETAKALQNSLLLLGNDLLNQNINQRFNLATLGANAAAGQATATQSTGAGIADLATQQGNARAAGIIGQGNQLTNLGNNIFSLAGLQL